MYTTIERIKEHLNIDQDFTADDQYLGYLYDVAEATVARHICCVLSDVCDDKGALPAPIVHAILLYIGDLYNSREGNTFGVTASQVPFTYDYLVNLYKNYADTTSEGFEAKALDRIAQGLYIDQDGNLKTNTKHI